MKPKLFVICFLFLIIQGFIFVGVNQVDLSPMLSTLNASPPDRPDVRVSWNIIQTFSDVGNAIGWIGQMIGWGLAKIGAFSNLVWHLIAPSMEVGSMYTFVTIINMIMIVGLVAAVIPEGIL